jgi:hypothetical protein
MLDLEPGETLAVSGGAGLLASYAIPLAKVRGLRVIADANPEDEELVRSFGADAIVPRGDFAETVRVVTAEGVDGVFDTALLRRDALPALRDGGGMAVVRDPSVAQRVAALVAQLSAPGLDRVKHRLWHGRVMRLATRPDIFKWTLFPLMYACTRLHWSIDMYFWEKIRPLHPMPEDYGERFSNVQAALALEGLGRLDAWTARRQLHARRMDMLLDEVPGIRVPGVPPRRTHVYYQYCVYGPKRDELVVQCVRRGVDIETLHVDVCSDMDLFAGAKIEAPGARRAAGAMQIPVYSTLTDEQAQRVARVVRGVLARAV